MVQRSFFPVIDCGYHGNDTSADPYMAIFVPPSRQPNSTQKMKGGGVKFFISNFASLSQRTALKLCKTHPSLILIKTLNSVYGQ